MTEGLSIIRDLRPPSDRAVLRARAAEKLIRASNPSRAVSELFDLIAPELRLNALMLYDVGESGKHQLVAYGGISRDQAAAVADDIVHAADAEPLLGHIKDVQASDDPRTAFVKSLGLTAYAALPLPAGGRSASILAFGRCWTKRFSEQDLAFLEIISGFFAAALDRLRSETAQRENDEQLRFAMKAAGFGTFDYDVVTGEHSSSPELKAIYGLAADAPLTPGMLARLAHPDDRQAVRDKIAEAAARSASSDFGEHSDEHRIIRPDGELRWVSVRGRMVFSLQKGKRQLNRFVGITQDITDRKLAEDRVRTSEERLQIAQELGGVSSWNWDMETGTLWVSDNFYPIHGLPPGSTVDSEVLASIMHPDDRERVFALTPHGAEKTSWDVEFRIIRPSDQEVRWIHSLSGLVRNGANDVVQVAGISIDSTDQVRDRERERLLVREVDHRANNLLNVVQSMIQLTRAGSMTEFVDEVTGRIHALAHVHSLIAASRWAGVDLSKLVEEELAPFTQDGERLHLSGPVIEFKPAAAQSMALVVHELAINAVKFGALSELGGQIEICWRLTDADAAELVFHWCESGGPAVRPPRKSGFGTTLINASVGRQLRGRVHMDWKAAGLQCEIILPDKQLRARAESHA